MFASSSVQQQQQALVASARLNNLHAHNNKKWKQPSTWQHPVSKSCLINSGAYGKH
jgi:hypothetical protein